MSFFALLILHTINYPLYIIVSATALGAAIFIIKDAKTSKGSMSLAYHYAIVSTLVFTCISFGALHLMLMLNLWNALTYSI